MKIQTKYLILTVGLLAAVCASISVLTVRSQREVLRAQSRERIEAVAEGAARIAGEALAAKDRLMLVGYLMFLRQSHPELAYARSVLDGKTDEIGADGPGLVYVEKSSGKEGATVRLGFIRSALEAEVGRALSPLMRRTYFIAAAALLFGILANIYLGALLARPIEKLARATALVAQGRTDVRVPVVSNDEVGALSDRFNRMTVRLGELMRFREDILHALTHEINTPLSGIRGYLELWEDRKLPEDRAEQKEIVSTMLAAVLNMENSLQSALRLFRGEHLEPHPDEENKMVWVNEVLDEVTMLFSPVARARSVTLRHLPKGQMGFIYCRKEALRQIAVNLVSNAVKYTPAGGEVRVGLDGEKAGLLTFWVADTGYGIPKEDIPHIFTKFYRSQEERSQARRIPGTGLGLNITHKAVAFMGGRIRVESEEGRGTAFYIDLPKQGRLPTAHGGGTSSGYPSVGSPS